MDGDRNGFMTCPYLYISLHIFTYLYLLDDVKIFDNESKKEIANAWLTSTVPVTLTPGWHRLQIRTYAWGYGSAKAGIAIDAPLEKLWGLSCSGRPPQAGR